MYHLWTDNCPLRVPEDEQYFKSIVGVAIGLYVLLTCFSVLRFSDSLVLLR